MTLTMRMPDDKAERLKTLAVPRGSRERGLELLKSMDECKVKDDIFTQSQNASISYVVHEREIEPFSSKGYSN